MDRDRWDGRRAICRPSPCPGGSSFTYPNSVTVTNSVSDSNSSSHYSNSNSSYTYSFSFSITLRDGHNVLEPGANHYQ